MNVVSFLALVLRRIKAYSSERIPLIGALIALMLTALYSKFAMGVFMEPHRDPTVPIRSFGWGELTSFFNLYALFIGFVGIPSELRSGRFVPVLSRSVSREIYYLSSWAGGAMLLAAFELVRSGAVIAWIYFSGGKIYLQDGLGIACIILGYWFLLAFSSLLGTFFGPAYGFLVWFGIFIFASIKMKAPLVQWFVPKILGNSRDVEILLSHAASGTDRGWEILLYEFSWTGLLVIAGMLLLLRKEIQPR